MIKLIASDLDDTLLDRDGRISRENREVVQEAVARGVIFTLVTGRMFHSAAPFAHELGLDEQQPIICYNGALIQRLSGEVLYERYLSPELAQTVAEHGRERGWTVNVYYNDELYVAEINSDVERYAAGVQVGVTAVGDLVEFIKDGGKRLAKILIPGRPEDSRDRIAELRQLVGSQVEIASSKQQYIEITSANTTKGRALKWLAEFFGISPAEVLAIGDGNNDVSMLQAAGIAVAVGNASPAAKEAASYVTNPSWEHGVAEAIRKFVLAPDVAKQPQTSS